MTRPPPVLALLPPSVPVDSKPIRNRTELNRTESFCGATAWDRRTQVVAKLSHRSSLFESMIELVQPMAVIAVMSTLPLLLRWVGHFEASNTTPGGAAGALGAVGRGGGDLSGEIVVIVFVRWSSTVLLCECRCAPTHARFGLTLTPRLTGLPPAHPPVR